MSRAWFLLLLILIGLSSFTVGRYMTPVTTHTETIKSTLTETFTKTSYITLTKSTTTTLTKAITTTVSQETTVTESHPIPPSNLRVETVDFSKIVLTWHDNSDNENGFIIERSDDSSFFEIIGRTPPNALRFVDTSVEREKTYLYRVRAYQGSRVGLPSNVVVETATPYGIQLNNYFGGLGELETSIYNIRLGRDGFADFFNPYWNWRQWPTGSRGAEVEASIDFTDFVSGAGSQKLTIKRDNGSGEDTRLILSSWKVQPKNPAYSHFYPLPGDRLILTFYYKTSENIRNIEYSVLLYFIVRESGGGERYMPPLAVLNSAEAMPVWREVSFTTVIPKNLTNFTGVRVFITFKCMRTCSGTFWLDNFVLHTEPVKRLPLLRKGEINFMLAAIHGMVYTAETLELAQKYDLLLGGSQHNTYVKGLNPKILSLYYFNDPSLVVSRRNDSNKPPCMLRWDGDRPIYEFLPYRGVYEEVLDEWLLSSSTTSKYPRMDGKGYYIVREKYCEFLVDIGRDDVVETALNNIKKLHIYAGFRNPLLSPILFHDNLPNYIYLWNMDGAPPSKYPDRETRKAVLEKMLSLLRKEVLDPYPERKIIANIGTYSDEEFEFLRKFNYDGVFIEYFTRIFGRTHSPSRLYQQFQTLKEYPVDKFVILVDEIPGDYIDQWNEDPSLVPENIRKTYSFTIAAIYLVNRPNMYINIRSEGGSYSVSYVLKDLYIPIGRPDGVLTIVEGNENGALFLRRYTNGLVLLNTAPENGRSFIYQLDGVYRDRSGNTFSGIITIPPQTGFVLYKEISVKQVASMDDQTNHGFVQGSDWAMITVCTLVTAASLNTCGLKKHVFGEGFSSLSIRNIY